MDSSHGIFIAGIAATLCQEEMETPSWKDRKGSSQEWSSGSLEPWRTSPAGNWPLVAVQAQLEEFPFSWLGIIRRMDGELSPACQMYSSSSL